MALPKRTSWVWHRPDWPALHFDPNAVREPLSEARRMQGYIEGKASAIGIDHRGPMESEVLAHEVLSTAAIEGERLDPTAVRSSVMRRLGLADAGPLDRHVDGLVEVVDDATSAFDRPLDVDRLFRWQSALFPLGTTGIRRIAVGRYRDHADPMQIVSGRPGREVIHYEAPPSAQVAGDMVKFLAWFARGDLAVRHPIDGLARAAIAHLWFETIHPFEDGNGRIGRAIADMAIAQDRAAPVRLYSLSRQMLASRGAYYDALNTAQRGNGDVTDWVNWFASQVCAACASGAQVIDGTLEKARFWADHAEVPLNARQRKVLQRLLDDGDGGFLGGMNAEKYVKMTGASKATATRDLADLVRAHLVRTTGRGKAIRYHVAVPGWRHGLDAPV